MKYKQSLQMNSIYFQDFGIPSPMFLQMTERNVVSESFFKRYILPKSIPIELIENDYKFAVEWHVNYH